MSAGMASTLMADLETIRGAKRDPAVFAEVLVGQPLWDHQRAVLIACPLQTCDGRIGRSA